MKTVQEIKLAIQKLSLDERAEIAAELCRWNDDDDWDQQMKATSPVGKMSEPECQDAPPRAVTKNSQRDRWN